MRLSTNTKTFPALVPSRGRVAGGGGRQVRTVEELARGPRRMVLNLREPANVRDSFPRPLIFSDHAVVAGLRLGGSQGKMPTLLLGCFAPPPRRLFFFFRHFSLSNGGASILWQRCFPGGRFPSFKATSAPSIRTSCCVLFVSRIQVHLSKKEDHQRGSYRPASQTKTP